MTTSCRFSSCQWSGPLDEIFTHFETYHPKYIREHKGKNYYDFTFADITKNAYLLCGPNGLYWFCPYEAEDNIFRGIFHIGDSEPIEYTIKLGLIRDGRAEYLGPFKSRCEESDDVYDLRFECGYIAFINEEMPSRRMRLYVGDYDDSDDVYAPQWNELTWSEKDEQLNRLCVENFTCCICFEFIKRDIRYCENMHYVCLNCFDGMQSSRKFCCPVCRSDYQYDCSDPDIERFLRMVKFPDDEEAEKRKVEAEKPTEKAQSSEIVDA